MLNIVDLSIVQLYARERRRWKRKWRNARPTRLRLERSYWKKQKKRYRNMVRYTSCRGRSSRNLTRSLVDSSEKIKDAIHLWLIRGYFVDLKGVLWVEQGLGRFISRDAYRAPSKDANIAAAGAYLEKFHGMDSQIIDETSVIFAGLQMLDSNIIRGAGKRLETMLTSSAGTGDEFESYFALWLATAFDGVKKLNEIFDFGDKEKAPYWAGELGQLVYMQKIAGTDDEDSYQCYTYDMSPLLKCGGGANDLQTFVQVPPVPIASRAPTIEETLAWLNFPTSAMLHPCIHDKRDVLAFVEIKSLKLVILVFVQIRFKQGCSQADVNNAAKTLEPSESFSHVSFLSFLGVALSKRDLTNSLLVTLSAKSSANRRS